ncbi:MULTISPECIES: peptidoglycan editing factor PgeF [Corynebacterium]|uniref:Purine nucleoside phosphorylase n=1 Tax=Corynebacterium aurimucosum TaxID=169292 RepID=A0A558GJ36_9CORY|nr:MULTISPECIES: peptidoglycan editing factor PgeF [Corynebacterium]MDK6812524.1 peptidoglycan editing factor PgeF [Corynebacterium sp. UMB6689]OFS36990.1 laccase [Corynebacterium sp. HMSC069E04]QQU94566.1 peptidoglycan editing factor PgeF [Corynebacterium aurimucosum]TVU56896.1 peptidoglycan editing factor PgeF [Corynebacterium aurimucosum]UTA72525.1 peptidoglycan editing factor PgeF [Corynebacterium aurimucosum]
MPVNEEAHAARRPVRMVFTTRAGGASSSPYDSFNLGDHVGDDPAAVAANRERLLRATGLEDIVWMEQLHTNTVTVVGAEHRGAKEPVPATDAVVTTEKRLGLGVLVADCTPVLLVDVSAGVIGAAHAGRLGARNGIVRNTVNAMIELGATPSSIQVLMGPAASGRNYEVPEQMAEDVEKHLPGSKTRTASGTWGVDVRAGVIRQLMGMGVTAIESDPRCTIEDTDFFSYRREGVTGRQAGVIWLED